MEVKRCEIPGVYVIEQPNFTNNRGKFVKTFHQKSFRDFGLESQFRECFYTVSKKNVIRGMHYQLPPRDGIKVIFVIKGAIVDVVLDIRHGSPTYGNYLSFDLNEMDNKMIYIPAGCAHGFFSKIDDSWVMYSHTEMYDEKYEAGIHFRSFGMNWGIDDPIVSDRDNNFQQFKDFKSKFHFDAS